MKQETTIQEVFSPADLAFRIPPYQRAYAWETAKDRKQVCQFLDDLKEHPQAGGERKSYFLGHFLFEREQAVGNEFFVIDGQQRLTTVVIFFTAYPSNLLPVSSPAKIYRQPTAEK